MQSPDNHDVLHSNDFNMHKTGVQFCDMSKFRELRGSFHPCAQPQGVLGVVCRGAPSPPLLPLSLFGGGVPFKKIKKPQFHQEKTKETAAFFWGCPKRRAPFFGPKQGVSISFFHGLGQFWSRRPPLGFVSTPNAQTSKPSPPDGSTGQVSPGQSVPNLSPLPLG